MCQLLYRLIAYFVSEICCVASVFLQIENAFCNCIYIANDVYEISLRLFNNRILSYIPQCALA